MIRALSAVGSLGSGIGLVMDSDNDGYIVKDIQGLGPVKATLVSTKFANQDGAQFQSSSREARNIVIKIDLEPVPGGGNVRDLRKYLYRIFSPETFVSLRFDLDDSDIPDFSVSINGWVESCEPNIFSKDPEIIISIMCFDPDFIYLNTQMVNGFTVSDTTDFLISSPGTTPTGIEFVLSLDRDLTAFTIYNTTGDGVTRSLDFAANLLAGDILTINTNTGSKSAKLLRGSTQSDVLYGVSPQANWIQILEGDNNFRVYAVGAPIPFEIVYTMRFGGL